MLCTRLGGRNKIGEEEGEITEADRRDWWGQGGLNTDRISC